MPISANPNDLLPYVLKIDRPADGSTSLTAGAPLPTFHLRYLTEMKATQVDQLCDEAWSLAATDRDRHGNLLVDAIRIGLARITNVIVDDKAITLDDNPRAYLSLTELRELAAAVAGETYLKERERLGFVLRPGSAAGSSAATVPAAADPAPTAPPPPAH